MQSGEGNQDAVSRRNLLLGVATAGAAVAMVGANASPAQAADVVRPGDPVKATEGGQFREALRKLGSDTAFRNEMTSNPSKIIGTGAFKLSMQDLRAMRTAALLSGVDLTEIDKLFNKAEASPIAADSTSCCCCCCCCGQSGVDVYVPA